MQDQANTTPTRVPWNKGKLTGAKPPLRPWLVQNSKTVRLTRLLPSFLSWKMLTRIWPNAGCLKSAANCATPLKIPFCQPSANAYPWFPAQPLMAAFASS